MPRPACPLVVLLLLQLSLTIGRSCAVYDAPNNTILVLASKLDDETYEFSLETDPSAFNMLSFGYDFLIPAASWYNSSMQEVGLAFQTVKTSANLNDTFQAYWAGFVELYISRDLTKAHFDNTFANFCADKSAACQTLESYLKRNLEMTIKKSLESGDIDPYWHQMELLLWQLRGLLDAWRNVTVTSSTTFTSEYLYQLTDDVFGIYLLQLSGDLSEISQGVGVFDDVSIGLDGKDFFANRPSCSALIKLTEDRKDFFMSHNTWQGYESMLKVMKYYDFGYHLTSNPDSPTIPADKVIFSSYPSVVTSIDDFYTTNGGLVVQETTNGNENADLWPIVRHGLNSTVLEAFRVMIANRLARTPSEWISYFSRHNSGTYNNQWMVLDAKLFGGPQPIPKEDVLWVAEQIPGFVQSADVTEHLLKNTYWASYNIPFFSFIHEYSGFDAKEREYGDSFSHNNCARAKIFRRNHSNVSSVPTAFKLMRYNDYMNDPISRCNCSPPYTAQFAIAARSDLNDPKGTYPLPNMKYRLHGATDVKLVNFAMAKELSMIVASGPTFDQVPVFEWSKLPVPHPRPHMHPDRWDFPPVVVKVDSYLSSQPVIRYESVYP